MSFKSFVFTVLFFFLSCSQAMLCKDLLKETQKPSLYSRIKTTQRDHKAEQQNPLLYLQKLGYTSKQDFLDDVLHELQRDDLSLEDFLTLAHAFKPKSTSDRLSSFFIQHFQERAEKFVERGANFDVGFIKIFSNIAAGRRYSIQKAKQLRFIEQMLERVEDLSAVENRDLVSLALKLDKMKLRLKPQLATDIVQTIAPRLEEGDFKTQNFFSSTLFGALSLAEQETKIRVAKAMAQNFEAADNNKDIVFLARALSFIDPAALFSETGLLLKKLKFDDLSPPQQRIYFALVQVLKLKNDFNEDHTSFNTPHTIPTEGSSPRTSQIEQDVFEALQIMRPTSGVQSEVIFPDYSTAPVDLFFPPSNKKQKGHIVFLDGPDHYFLTSDGVLSLRPQDQIQNELHKAHGLSVSRHKNFLSDTGNVIDPQFIVADILEHLE